MEPTAESTGTGSKPRKVEHLINQSFLRKALQGHGVRLSRGFAGELERAILDKVESASKATHGRGRKTLQWKDMPQWAESTQTSAE